MVKYSQTPVSVLPIAAIMLLAGFMLCSPLADVAAAKRKSAPVIPPGLRIVAVSAAPEPYAPEDGALDFNVEIELPKEVDEGALLEVSSLISSPSMSSMRFLSVRHPVPVQPSLASSSTALRQQTRLRMSMTLRWDGMDQSKQRVDSGPYQYEVRAKLLAVGENGPRTQMSAWPKRGTLIVQ